MLKAVLFDMDGTLIDTEKHYCRCWYEAVKFFGYDMTWEETLGFRSLGRPHCYPYLERMMQGRATYEEVLAKRVALMEERMTHYPVEVKPGAAELLAWLKARGILAAVVTSSGADNARMSLGKVGLLDCFGEIVSARNMERGKPEPDVYRFACRELGLLPEECVAVEDSPNGVFSAARAGCRVIMVPDQSPVDEEVRPFLWQEAETLAHIIPLLEKEART